MGITNTSFTEEMIKTGEILGLTKEETIELATIEFIKNHNKAYHFFYHLKEGSWYRIDGEKYVMWEKVRRQFAAKMIEVLSDKTIRYQVAGLPTTFDKFIADFQCLPLDFTVKRNGIVSVNTGGEMVSENMFESEKILLAEYIAFYSGDKEVKHFVTENKKKEILMDLGMYEAI